MEKSEWRRFSRNVHIVAGRKHFPYQEQARKKGYGKKCVHIRGLKAKGKTMQVESGTRGGIKRVDVINARPINPIRIFHIRILRRPNFVESGFQDILIIGPTNQQSLVRPEHKIHLGKTMLDVAWARKYVRKYDTCMLSTSYNFLEQKDMQPKNGSVTGNRVAHAKFFPFLNGHSKVRP